ncbi:MAG: septum formation protein [Candidatus Tokpelaia sp. JSC161]|jgi:septum formation protein|nr:MAG: septum formation protein [Candidatus Tokpelaia sp. JSC161]
MIILASESSIRARLLRNSGISVIVKKSTINEYEVAKNIDNPLAKELAQKLAEEKSKEVSLRYPHALIIGCDQVLEFEGKILHKPIHMKDAYNRLLSFSGKKHDLHSAVAFFENAQKIWSYVESASIFIRPLHSYQIHSYLARVGIDVLKTIGVYQIEGEGIQLIEKINGDYFTIAGLPLLPLLVKLRELRIIND